jgi:hypothetical protein
LQWQSKSTEDVGLISAVFQCGRAFDFFNRIGPKPTSQIPSLASNSLRRRYSEKIRRFGYPFEFSLSAFGETNVGTGD